MRRVDSMAVSGCPLRLTFVTRMSVRKLANYGLALGGGGERGGVRVCRFLHCGPGRGSQPAGLGLIDCRGGGR